MADPLADNRDVEAAMQSPLTGDQAQLWVPDLIVTASALLRSLAPSIDARIAAYSVNPADPFGRDPRVVASVIAESVKAVLVNPYGAVSISNTDGPFSTALGFSRVGVDTGQATLRITPGQLELLFPKTRRRQIGSIRTRAALAPRPVGRYGPLSTPANAAAAVIDFGADRQ